MEENNIQNQNENLENQKNEEPKNTEFTPITSQEELNSILEDYKNQLKQENEKTIANERKRYEDKTKKLERQIELSKLSEEERIKALAEETTRQKEEETNALKEELATLRKEKRDSEIKSKLLEQKLPPRYLNDVRLINSNDVDKTIRDLKKEYDDEMKNLLQNNVRDSSPNITTTTSKKQSSDNGIEDLKKYLGF